MDHFIEEFCFVYLCKYQGDKKVTLKNHSNTLSREEWNDNIRYWVTKSNNRSKYTINRMDKDVGTLFNGYPITKLMNVYLIKLQTIEQIDERYSEMDHIFSYDLVVDELDTMHNHKECFEAVLEEVELTKE